jgi:RNA polymerase sigma-32 factor
MNKAFPHTRTDRKLAPRAEFLDAANEARLARAWRETGDVAARNRLVTSHHALALAAARRAGGKGRDLDNDILQQANIGLLKAADRFDPDMGYRFSTYAAWWIRAEIQDYRVQNWSMVRLPNSASGRKLFYNLKRVETQLMASGEVAPEDLDNRIATELAVPPQHVVQMRQRLNAQDASLNRPVGLEDDGAQLQDLLEDPSANVETTVSATMDARSFWKRMATQLKRLSKREQEIIIESYVSESPKTLAELGERFGVSRERIRQIRETAVTRLRASLSDAV